jgi:hypothetical protein
MLFSEHLFIISLTITYVQWVPPNGFRLMGSFSKWGQTDPD